MIDQIYPDYDPGDDVIEDEPTPPRTSELYIGIGDDMKQLRFWLHRADLRLEYEAKSYNGKWVWLMDETEFQDDEDLKRHLVQLRGAGFKPLRELPPE